MKCTIFVDILLLIGVVYLFSCCNGDKTTSDNSKTYADYSIDHYIDTINGHVILTTVCNHKDGYNISVSTLELK